jgi:glutathione S-transferase
MTFEPLSVYALSVVVLFAKLFAAISVQARERFRTRAFKYPEDAVQWRGQVAPDSDLCQRADRLLRNDAESQMYYFALGGLLVVIAPGSRVLPYYFVVYTLARLVHAYWLLVPRQPHRNRAFALGLTVVFCMVGHVVWAVTR